MKDKINVPERLDLENALVNACEDTGYLPYVREKKKTKAQLEKEKKEASLPRLTIPEMLDRAKKLLKKRNIVEALGLYNFVRAIEPDNPIVFKEIQKIKKQYPKHPAIQALNNPSQPVCDEIISLFKDNKFVKNKLLCQKLLETYPQSDFIYSVLSNIAKRQGFVEDALEYSKVCLKIKPNVIGYLHACAELLERLDKLEEALQHYQKIIEKEPDNVMFQLTVARLEQNMGLFKECEQRVDHVLLKNPDCLAAYNLQTQYKKYKLDDPQMDILKAFLEKEETKEQQKISIYFILYEIYKQLKDYKNSFNYLKQGNDLRSEKLTKRFDSTAKMIENIALVREFFNNSEVPVFDSIDLSNNTVKPIFIVSMPRSGSSLTDQILSSHSQVFGGGEMSLSSDAYSKIIRDPGKQFLLSKDVEQIRHDYLSGLAELKVQQKMITDDAKGHWMNLGFLLTAFPDAKFINLTRDPRATCWSIYNHNFAHGHEYGTNLIKLANVYKKYKEMMLFWEEKFPGRFYNLCYERLTENQEEETRKLLEYCELDWEPQCLSFHKTERAVKTASLAQVRKKMYKGSSAAWMNYESFIEPLLKELGY